MKVALVQPDTHYPFQKQSYVELLYKVADSLKPDIYINLGDALDFWQISRFDKDPSRKGSVDYDMDLFKSDLKVITKILPKSCRKIFISGNHEFRLEKYIWSKCPDIVNLVKSVKEYCGFEELGWDYFEYGKLIKIGQTIFMHGDLTGINVGMSVIRKYGMNVVHGHAHSSSIRWFQNARDRVFALNCGHLSDQEKQSYLYGGVADWSSGFGIVHFSDDYQRAVPIFVPIEDNRCVVNGVEFKV